MLVLAFFANLVKGKERLVTVCHWTNKDVKIVDPIDIGGDLEIQIPNRQKETFTLISAIEHQGEDPRG